MHEYLMSETDPKPGLYLSTMVLPQFGEDEGVVPVRAVQLVLFANFL
jgi:hypothetical protein